ncbi:spermatogenesis-defective protein 39 homolog [Mya arenaria]|uniref:spermatogenesis-defective protein 39 homolog n=1 Tax=Mya arenaria TaxID=6604 RepID=UPI0022DF6033|nr:spermatogenesis-defective protein 39 homolog [Mya arenaria]
MEESEDSYWQASKVKDSRKKRNIFDDDVTVEKASEIAIYKKSLHGDDGDDDDAIGWNDDVISPSTQINFQPKNRSEQQLQQQQQQQQPHNSAPSSMPRPTFDPRNDPPPRPLASYMTHNRSRSEVLVGGMGKLSLSQSPSLLTEPSLSTRVSEPSIAAVMDSGILNVVSVGPQSSRQKDDEIQYLRTQLQNAEKALGVSKLKVEETVKRMILGQPFSLEQYRSKQEKLDLLDKAIATHDGNAIIAVVVFLKRTLKEQLFNLELMRRPVAVEQYLAYLKAHFNLHQYEHMLQLLGKAEDQAMLKLRQAVTVEDPVAKMDRLRTCQHSTIRRIRRAILFTLASASALASHLG